MAGAVNTISICPEVDHACTALMKMRLDGKDLLHSVGS